MESKIRDWISKFQKREISKEDFVLGLPLNLINEQKVLERLLWEIIKEKNNKDLNKALTVLWILNKGNEQINILNKLLLEDWHTRYEDIIHEIQKQKSESSIQYIKRAMQTRYPYLVSYGTGVRQFINQCGHALESIGTDEAIKVIHELAKANDLILKDEMLYRISKMDGSNNYQRNYDLDDTI